MRADVGIWAAENLRMQIRKEFMSAEEHFFESLLAEIEQPFFKVLYCSRWTLSLKDLSKKVVNFLNRLIWKRKFLIERLHYRMFKTRRIIKILQICCKSWVKKPIIFSNCVKQKISTKFKKQPTNESNLVQMLFILRTDVNHMNHSFLESLKSINFKRRQIVFIFSIIVCLSWIMLFTIGQKYFKTLAEIKLFEFFWLIFFVGRFLNVLDLSQKSETAKKNYGLIKFGYTWLLKNTGFQWFEKYRP